MRFFSDGPLIPNDLLQKSDQGQVVFFCGAGISMPAGLPSFFSLAQSIISSLGVPEGSKSRRLFERITNEVDPEFAPPLDQIFGLLQQEYTREKIELEVARLLKIPRKADTSFHDIILRISRDLDRSPLVVTTNFDHLFEKAQKGLRYWSPPSLPDMSVDLSADGVVYLHGRLPTKKVDRSTSRYLVLGSSDFGRAYLADGWAATFVRRLLERRVVVLIGYQADDPPVRYLLEGLTPVHSPSFRQFTLLIAANQARSLQSGAIVAQPALPIKEKMMATITSGKHWQHGLSARTILRNGKSISLVKPRKAPDFWNPICVGRLRRS